MWVYRVTTAGQYEVGYYTQHDSWWVLTAAYADENDARALVNYLNGGDGKKLNVVVPNE